MYNKSKSDGFQLIEILIAMAIIGMTTHWMIANYQSTFSVAKRHDAERALFMLSVALEEYALVNHSYKGASFDNLKLASVVAKNSYQLQIIHADRDSFLIAAKPTASQALLDKQCGTLSLTSEGIKHVTGSASWDQCW